jgi:hypothetical protein
MKVSNVCDCIQPTAFSDGISIFIQKLSIDNSPAMVRGLELRVREAKEELS